MDLPYHAAFFFGGGGEGGGLGTFLLLFGAALSNASRHRGSLSYALCTWVKKIVRYSEDLVT